MDAHAFILEKQIQWAKNHNIELTGSKGAHGYPSYTISLDRNLFEPLLAKVEESYNAGDGHELKRIGDNPAKMWAVHSSSALCVNVFQYWLKNDKINEIACALNLCGVNNKNADKMEFENKFNINIAFQRCPNIDVVIENKTGSEIKALAIESKFTEPYSSYKHAGMDPKYLENEECWKDIPNLKKLAKEISPIDSEHNFCFLNVAQLIKHVLGLKKKYGSKSCFRLQYLWYNVPGKQGSLHEEEIKKFTNIIKCDGIMFHSMSYQELICKIAKKYRNSESDYVQFITSRYL